jgi:uncharacterized protein (DUF736 family)
MTKQYDNELRGASFKNDRKTTDNHPNYKGSATIEGVEYWLSTWVKTSKDGTKYLSHSFSPKEVQNRPQDALIADNKPMREPAKATAIVDDMDDDLPF